MTESRLNYDEGVRVNRVLVGGLQSEPQIAANLVTLGSLLTPKFRAQPTKAIITGSS